MPSTRTSKVLSHCSDVSVTLAAVSCAVAIGACGSSGRPSSAAASRGSTQGVRYADCMRSHGAPNFPDPGADGSINLPSGIDPQAPAFRSTQHACANLQPNDNSPKPALSKEQEAGMVANAQCIRKHGVPNFPDPFFAPGGRGAGVNLPPGLQPRSPAIYQASHACAHVGTSIPGA